MPALVPPEITMDPQWQAKIEQDIKVRRAVVSARWVVGGVAGFMVCRVGGREGWLYGWKGGVVEWVEGRVVEWVEGRVVEWVEGRVGYVGVWEG